MANKKRGEKTLRVGETSVTLVPSFENIANFEDALDSSIMQVINSVIGKTIKLRELVIIIRIASNVELKDDAVGEAILEQGMVEVTEIIATFLVNALNGGQKQGKPKAANE